MWAATPTRFVSLKDISNLKDNRGQVETLVADHLLERIVDSSRNDRTISFFSFDKQETKKKKETIFWKHSITVLIDSCVRRGK